MALSKRRFLQLSAAAPFLASIANPALAAKPNWFEIDGVAIRGYDPVGYFKESQPVLGLAAFSAEFDGVKWNFANAGNLADFNDNPTAFVPQFGGYCAYAVSKGSTATTQPDAWTVWNGKLYLNFNTTVRGIWQQDIPDNVAKAEANWPAVLA